MASSLDFAVGSEAAFVADGGGVAAFFERGLERVENLDAPAQGFGEAGSAHGHDHELLEVHGIIGVRAAIENIHHGDGEEVGGSVRGVAREIFMERLLESGGGGAGGGHGNGEDGVGAETGFVGRAVEGDHFLVEGALVGGVHAGDDAGDFGIDVVDGLKNALAEVTGFVAVAQFHGFVLASGGAGGNGGAAHGAVDEEDVGGVRDLARTRRDDRLFHA